MVLFFVIIYRYLVPWYHESYLVPGISTSIISYKQQIHHLAVSFLTAWFLFLATYCSGRAAGRDKVYRALLRCCAAVGVGAFGGLAAALCVSTLPKDSSLW